MEPLGSINSLGAPICLDGLGPKSSVDVITLADLEELVSIKPLGIGPKGSVRFECKADTLTGSNTVGFSLLTSNLSGNKPNNFCASFVN